MPSPRKWLVACLVSSLVAAVSLAPAARAQVPVRPEVGERVCFPDWPGVWGYHGSTDAATFGITQAQARTFLAKIEALRDVVRAAPVFDPPRGFTTPGVAADFCCPSECQARGTCRTQPVYGRLWIRLNYWLGGRDGRPFFDDELRTEFELQVNRPFLLANAALPKLPDGRRMALEPVPWREVNGVTLYDNQGDDDLWVILTHGRRPLWVPVSRGQLLEALIRERDAAQREAEADWERAAAVVARQGADVQQARAGLAKARAMLVGELQAQLAAMSPAERASQAWVAVPSAMSPLVPAGAKGARPVVVFDPDYFDRDRPRTDVQLVTVRLEGIPRDGPRAALRECSDVAERRLWELVNQLDWRRIAAAVEK